MVSNVLAARLVSPFLQQGIFVAFQCRVPPAIFSGDANDEKCHIYFQITSSDPNLFNCAGSLLVVAWPFPPAHLWPQILQSALLTILYMAKHSLIFSWSQKCRHSLTALMSPGSVRAEPAQKGNQHPEFPPSLGVFSHNFSLMSRSTQIIDARSMKQIL